MPRFVVQEHWATQHHFDFRLEMDGVLKSWAVPKGVPVAPGIRHLAMQVGDHRLEYGSFEGVIPKGEYGAGKVEVWDKGDFTLEERTPTLIRFTLQGAKLEGEYALVLMKADKGQWLLLKRGPSKQPAGPDHLEQS
jgi:DNA ligase D-like protein (predicted 3'-phosphoesterase)